MLMTETKKDTKLTWKNNLEDFFHNYFIGISHLECSNQDCPLVANWDEIEAKNSKQGLCALYKITNDNFLVVDAKIGNTNDLGTYENIELTLPSGVKRRTEFKEINKSVNIQTSGNLLSKNKQEKEIFLKDNEFVLFFNNQTHSPNLKGAEDYFNEIWDIKEKIKWDQHASKKIVLAEFETDPDDDDWEPVINGFEKGFIAKIAPDNITNSIKKTEFLNAGNNNEREKLWTDYKEIFSELRRVFGICHLTSKKEERQNNPEIELNEAQFIALERRKKRIREASIKDAEDKGFCLGEHVLTYGTSPEQREAKIQELEEIKELDNENEQEIKENHHG
ncbi:MAG: hypothetical protein GBAus27B_000428 [Mycoplasmataceae bacterium]|nr:MAG: hypothetical protein GBAus27B_000428 [Mycoplasmataceae bacterium]